MGRQELKLNFQMAKDQANRLDEIGREIQKVAQNEYEETLNGIRSAWKGENADAYLAKAGELKAKIEQTGQHIS